QANPKLLGKTPDAKAARIISAAFALIGKQLNETNEGLVKMSALGTFVVKQVEREQEGQKTTVKKIAFRASKAKAK
ncbi:MAG: hypothetical protein Q8N96_01585, partial [Methylovulum sp.]|nr:hypothetical protein [Methylovulum sp.]